MKRKILFLSSSQLKPNMLTVLSNFGEMLHNEFELDLITGVSNEYSSAQIEKFYTIHRFNQPKWFSQIRFPYQSLRSFAKSNKIDIVINIAHPYPIGLAVALLAPKYGAKSVIRITGDIFNERFLAKNALHRAWKIFFYENLMLYILKRADKVLPIGREIENGFLNRGFPKEKLFRISQPFRLELFNNYDSLSKAERKVSLSLNKEKTTFLFVGRLTWGKGIDRIIEIIESLKNASFDFEFCFIGDGPYYKQLESLGYDEIVLKGRLDRLEIPAYYCASDLFVYPTRTDGLPNVIIEAIAAGLPIVSTPIGEIPHLTKNVFSSTEEITAHILTGNYERDSMQEWFDWDFQRKMYTQLLIDL